MYYKWLKVLRHFDSIHIHFFKKVFAFFQYI